MQINYGSPGSGSTKIICVNAKKELFYCIFSLPGLLDFREDEEGLIV
jgi:hypothetical protein